MLIQSMNDVTNPINLLGYWNGLQSEQQPYLADTLLQNTPVNQSTVNLFYGSNRPVDGMQLSPNNSKVAPEGNGSFNSKPFNLMQFRSLRVMDEDRQEQLEDLLAANQNNQQFIQALTRNEYNDAAKQITSAHKQREIMFIQALLNGKIDISDSSNRRVADFDMQDIQKQGVKTPWGNKDAQPLTNLHDAAQTMSDYNSSSEAVAIMNTHTFEALANSGEVKNTLLPNSNNGNLTVDLNQVRQLVGQRTGLSILRYDKTTKDDNGVDQRMIPDGKVVITPGGYLGRLAWKPTSESRMLAGKSNVQIANTGDGITLASYDSINPTGLFSLASQKMLPLVDTIQNIITLDVYKEGSTNSNNSTIAPLSELSNGSTNSTSSSSNSSNSKSSNSSSK